jgi:hypothetical protein
MSRRPVQVLGLQELQRQLEQLPDRMQQNVLRAGNRAVANELKKEVLNSGGNVPATVLRAVSAQPNPERMATKGFLVGLKKPVSKMAHWFEFGTGPREQKTTGRSTGAMRATPWLRPALERLRPRVEQIWARAASRNLALQLRKMAGRGQ